MRVKIRAAQPSDAKAISKLIREELATPVSASDTAQKLAQLCVSPRHRIFVADVDTVVVGFLHACDFDSILMVQQMKYITAMAVGTSYRRIGIGTTLIHRAERWAAESGAAGVRLDIEQDSEIAHAFLRKCGYTVDQSQMRYQKQFNV